MEVPVSGLTCSCGGWSGTGTLISGYGKAYQKNKLVIPLDTHIARISRCLGFTERKSQDWKMAVEITESLKKFDPEDPLKYDFALCHHGISGVCKGEKNGAECKGCMLKSRRT